MSQNYESQIFEKNVSELVIVVAFDPIDIYTR